jgi:hypothetical protein
MNKLNKVECYNITIGWKGLPEINTLKALVLKKAMGLY